MKFYNEKRKKLVENIKYWLAIAGFIIFMISVPFQIITVILKSFGIIDHEWVVVLIPLYIWILTSLICGYVGYKSREDIG